MKTKMFIFLFSRPSRQLEANNVLVNDYLVSATTTTTFNLQHNWRNTFVVSMIVDQWAQTKQHYYVFTSPPPFFGKNIETTGIWAWKQKFVQYNTRFKVTYKYFNIWKLAPPHFLVTSWSLPSPSFRSTSKACSSPPTLLSTRYIKFTYIATCIAAFHFIFKNLSDTSP